MAKLPPPPPFTPPSSSPPPGLEEEDGTGVFQTEKRKRTAKYLKLEEAVGGIYIMLGGGITTIPRTMAPPQMKMVGMGLVQNSGEIAEAWVDLAEDDPKVRKVLESLTSFSGWGKVIGVHMMVVGTSMPGIAAVMPTMPGMQQPPPQPQQQGNGMPGVSPEDMMILGELFRQTQSQARAPEQQPQQPQYQPPPVRAEQAPPPPQPPSRPRAGMPSAADMGVSVPDVPMDFPTAGSENIRG